MTDIITYLRSISLKVERIYEMLVDMKAREQVMAADLTTLQQQVTASTTVQEGAITLLNSLSAQIASLKNDPVAIQALADQLKSESDKLAAAIVANTPAA